MPLPAADRTELRGIVEATLHAQRGCVRTQDRLAFSCSPGLVLVDGARAVAPFAPRQAVPGLLLRETSVPRRPHIEYPLRFAAGANTGSEPPAHSAAETAHESEPAVPSPRLAGSGAGGPATTDAPLARLGAREGTQKDQTT